MGFHFPRIVNVKQIVHRILSFTQTTDVPNGHFAVYIGGTQKNRFVIPNSYLKHPSFQDLLSIAEEEFGFNHPVGGLTIPCSEKVFTDLICGL